MTSTLSDSPATEAAQIAAPRRPLTLDRDVDVCVVGAGLAGLTTALELSRQGLGVTVLESGRVGGNASARTLGTVMPGYALPITDVAARVGPDDARRLWALSKQGADHVRRIAVELGAGLTAGNGALEVSTVDGDDRLISRVRTLTGEFGAEVEGWRTDRVRDVLSTRRYFQAVHYPGAFQIDGDKYLHGLAALAEAAGVRICEHTPVQRIDAGGIRKRIVTPAARLRASHIVLAGNVHLGALSPRLSGTLAPVWRYAAVSAPLGGRLAQAIAFRGSVMDNDGIDHFRVVDGDRLMWESAQTTWPCDPRRFSAIIRRRIRTVFPTLGRVELDGTWSGAIGETVHGMPQIGELRRGLWLASGFGRQGLNTSAVAAQLISAGIRAGDDRWRLFSPFELVWAGGRAGRIAGQVVSLWIHGRAAAAGTLARLREQARLRDSAREARLAAASRRAGGPK